MFQLLEGATPYREADAEEYTRSGWWSGLTLGDLLDLAADLHPNRVGFVDTGNRVTYREARERADRLAIGLLGLGIKPLDPAMIQLPNWTEIAYA